MAYVDVSGGGLWFPWQPGDIPAFRSFVLDASGEKFAMVFRVPKTGDLDRFEFDLGAVTQAPANGLKCSFQDLDLTTGDPDGIVDETVTVTTGLTANTWVDPGAMRAGTVARAVTRGDYVCAVIEFASFLTGDSLAIRVVDMGPTDAQQFPYCTHFTTAWAKNRQTSPNIALKYTDGSYYPLGGRSVTMSAITSTAFNSADIPDERALLFQIPWAVKIGEVYVEADVDNDADLVLYDSNGSTVLETVAIDKDVRAITTPGSHYRLLAADRELLANTDYYLSYKPGASNSNVREFDVSVAAHLGIMTGGTNVRYASRTDAGAWTTMTTRRLLAGVKIVAIDIPAGGGGLKLVGPGGLAG